MSDLEPIFECVPIGSLDRANARIKELEGLLCEDDQAFIKRYAHNVSSDEWIGAARDLSSRLRAVDRKAASANARIEQLERELDEARGLERDTYATSKSAFNDLQAELAAEKAMADRLHKAWATRAANPKLAEAYRKARGL